MRKVQLTIKQEEVAPATTSDLVVMNNGRTLKEELSTNVLDKFSREVTVSNSMSKIIDGTLDGVYESGVMYGRSLVNLITNATRQGVNMTSSYDDSTKTWNISSGASWSKLGFVIQGKPNTKYYFLCKDKHSSVEFYFRSGDSIHSNVATTTTKINDYSYTFVTYPETGTFMITFELPSNTANCYVTQPMIIEYQDGMENWDIPYFEGICDVKMPILRNVGKNLFDNDNAEIFNGYSNGVNVVSNNNMRSAIFKVNGGRTYTVQKTPTNRFAIDCSILKPKNNAPVKRLFNVNTQTKATITVPYGYNYIIIYYANLEAGDALDTVAVTQIEEGSTATSYEPYKSSVSTILGTNLIIDSEKGRYYHHENGNKVTNGGSRYDSYRANVEGLKMVYVKNAHSNYTFWDANMNFISGVPFVNELARPTNSQGKDGIVKVPSNAKYMRFAYDTIENNGLPCVSEVIALRKVGDVQDELDLETGKLTQRVGEVVLDGSENYWYSREINENTIRFTNDSLFNSSTMFGINDKLYQCNQEYQGSNDVECLCIRNDKTGVGIRVSKQKLSSLDFNGFKQWLSQNPITVQYELAKPITTIVEPSTIPFAYENGHIILESGFEGQSLLPELKYSAPASKNGVISTTSKAILKHEQRLHKFEDLLLRESLLMDYRLMLTMLDSM